MKNDDFGDRMKEYEGVEAQRKLMPLLPICVRLDGKGFSKFTKGLKRPYDDRMSRLMIDTTKALVQEANALVGYTQSDEISLIVYSPTRKSQVYFGGRIQKIVGDLAAFASLYFNRELPYYLPEKKGKMPRFYCRVWNVPTKLEATNTILWREQDATKNSISMAASHYYSHKQLHLKNGKDKQDMLMEKGVNWNDYPSFFKRGVFIRKEAVTRAFTSDELYRLPAKHQARTNPDLQIERQEIREVDMPSFGKVKNRVEVLFEGAVPITEDEKINQIVNSIAFNETH